VKTGEGHLRLAFDTYGAEDPQVASPFFGVPEQRRLSDAGFPAHDECGSATGPGSLERVIDDGTLRGPTPKHTASVLQGAGS
jgi:hypothetical protein